MITCDDGYEWLDGVNVPYGQQINTTHNTGVAGTKWNTTEGKFYDEQADTPWVMNGYLVDATKGKLSGRQAVGRYRINCRNLTLVDSFISI